MDNIKFAKLANYSSDADKNSDQSLAKVLDSLAEVLEIEYGSVTVHFHHGQWSPKLEIKKNVFKKIGK